jgi:putative ABC transport system substrate-binding protein
LTAEFVRLNVNVIFTGGTPAIVAKQATSFIPIVFVLASDPVGIGLVASLARPGGNITGLSTQATDIVGKRLELLGQILPAFRRLSVLTNAANPAAIREVEEVQANGRTVGLEVTSLEIRRAEDIAPAFERLKGSAQALYVCADPLLFTYRGRINTLALGARLPTMHTTRESVDVSGLMSYAPNYPDQFRRAAEIVDKILRGAKPADIPVEQPTKFDLVINITTAKALGLTIPESFLLRADEVIE